MKPIYKAGLDESGTPAGHVDFAGRIYADPLEENRSTYAGYVAPNGYVFRKGSTNGGYVGHVDDDGNIYTDTLESENTCIGHVSGDGLVYATPGLRWDGPKERDDQVVALCNDCSPAEAGAAYLLLVYDGQPVKTEKKKKRNRQQKKLLMRERSFWAHVMVMGVSYAGPAWGFLLGLACGVKWYVALPLCLLWVPALGLFLANNNVEYRYEAEDCQTGFGRWLRKNPAMHANLLAGLIWLVYFMVGYLTCPQATRFLGLAVVTLAVTVLYLVWCVFGKGRKHG